MSAVILAVIVIMWAVVLVPMWLRRHDTVTESRSVDRFSTAMRVLSRRGQGAPDRRYVLMPKRDAQATVHVSGAAAHRRPPARPTRPSPAAPPARPRTRTSLAVRRRRALLALAGVTFLTFVLTLTGVIGWPLQLVVDLILVAFVVHLRTQAKRAAAVSRQRRRAAVAPPAARPAYASAYAPGAAPAPRVPMTADERATEPMQPVEPAAAQAAATGTDDRWEPVPVPRPTYTMKPKAPQRWTYVRPEAPAAEAAVVAEAAPPAPGQPQPAEVAEAVTELDGILEHRWAVND